VPKEPEIVFKGKFTDWIEYLSIARVYYDLDTCRKKVAEYLLVYPELMEHKLNLTFISEKLCEIDGMFPPNGLWVEYYRVIELNYIIVTANNKRNSVLL